MAGSKAAVSFTSEPMIKRNIPNAITCLNLVAGVLAIICAEKGVEPLWGLLGWQWASIFVGIAAVADFFDGFFARLLRAYSELGKELDSLCDLVSFGVAPSLILFHVLPAVDAIEWYRWTVFLVPVAAAVRLAKFNIDPRQTSFFIGLPVPANAIFWIGFCGMLFAGARFLLLPVVFIPLLLLESWLMISPFKLFSLKFSNYRFGENKFRYFLIVTAIALVFCMGVGGLMWLIPVYFLFSVIDGVK